MTTIVKKNKKTAAGIGIAAAAAAVLAIGAGTYAGFFDTEDGPATTAAAGTLFFGTSTSTPLDPFENLAPGDAATRTLTYTNGGSLPGVFDLSFTQLGVDEEGDPHCAGGNSGPEAATGDDCSPEGDTGELDDQSTVAVTAQVGSDPVETVFATGSIANLVTDGFEYQLQSGETVTFTLTVTFVNNTTAAPNTIAHNNAAQGDSFTLESTANLNQAP